ncbi:MAG: PSD1 and planctomycete cytochrome C domain-containing protein [Phycisphaeraceae bacterium]
MKRYCPAIFAVIFFACDALSKEVDFHTEVAPILMKHCYECHGGTEAKGGFSINTRALWLDKKAAKPGNGKASEVVLLMREEDPEFAMPPKDKPRMAEAEIVTLTKWIDQGMKWDEGFTFAKSTYEPPLAPRRPELPKALPGRDNPVDRIIDNYMIEQKLKKQPELEDAAFYRRASMDLIGLLPDPADVERFAKDSDPNKHAALVDKLLANDRAYAQHWMTFFNDLLRNDYTGTGYITGGRKSITNWLFKSLLDNKPYDQLTRELLAPTKESEGFIRGIKWRGDVNASQTTEIQFAQNVGQVFLGINIKCASCHDSFLDSWTLEESYELAAIYSDKPLEINRCDKPTGKIAKPGWLFPELGEVDPKAPKNERLKQLANLMTAEGNGRLTRTITNRLWHRLMGRGVIHPVDAMETRPWSEDLLDQLAISLSDEKYNLKSVLRLITTSHAYRSSSLKLEKEPETDGYIYAGPLLKRMTAEQLMDAIRQVTETQPPGDTRASMKPSDFLQRALGRPNREQVVTSRPQELTTLQALDLANGEALNKMIQQGATSLLNKHKGKDPQDMIKLVYNRALSRDPSPAERNICRKMLGDPMIQQGLEDMLWSVFMLPEFQHIQ